MLIRMEKLRKRYSSITPTKICGAISLIFVFSILFYLLFTFAILSTKTSIPIQVLYIQSKEPGHFKTSSKFLSVGLDTIIIAMGFKNFNMTDVKLMRMMKYLAPGYLRIGGNLADKLFFSPYGERNETVQNFYRMSYDESSNHRNCPNFSMTGSQWLHLVKLAKKAHLDIFFDLNSLLRLKNGSWDSRNARQLIEFSNVHKLRVNWELGNEPNSFKHKFNEEVNASQMASDFATLRTILNGYPLYRNSMLIGPDVTRPRINHKESQLYLEEFLRNSSHTIDAISWHQYYLNGRTAQAEDFLNPKIFDYLKYQIKTVKEIISSSHSPESNMYLGETSSAYGGGAPNLSDSFIGSFIWADKLGLAAQMGVKVVMRQSIFHGNYALLNDNYDPNPDWWVSVLYKKLVGQIVVPHHTIISPSVRLYVHCSKRTLFGQQKNSITVLGMNLDNNVKTIRIAGLHSENSKGPSKVYVFELTSDTLLSKSVFLNGNPLKMLPDNRLPLFFPILKRLTPFIKMSPYSIVFWVIPNTHVEACL